MSKIIMTDAGAMVAGSLIHVGRIDSVVGGYVQTCPRYVLSVALRADMTGWEALYEGGGDWSGVSADHLLDVLSLGGLDDSMDSVSERLIAGSGELHAWADAVSAIDPANEALAELADYLHGRANEAERRSGDTDYCAELAREAGEIEVR